MSIEYWLMLSYVVGTATGWYMFRVTKADKEELITHSVDTFLNLLIAGNCVNVKHLDDGEIEILTVDEHPSEINDCDNNTDI